MIKILIIVSALVLAGCKPAAKKFDARVAFTAGQPEGSSDQQKWQRVHEAQLLPAKTLVRTDIDSRVDLQVPQGKIRLLGNTVLSIERLAFNESYLKAQRGNFLVKASKLRGGTNYTIETALAITSVKGAEFTGRINRANNTATFAVRHGAIEVTRKADNKKVVINSKQAVDLAPGKELKAREALEIEMNGLKEIDQM